VRIKTSWLFVLGGSILFNACAGNPVENLPISNNVSTLTETIKVQEYSTQTITPTLTFTQISWQEIPVIPNDISPRTREIYRVGEGTNKRGNAFSIVGDCLSTPTYFLTNYDGNRSAYDLGDFEYLQSVIDAFHGSFSRPSLAVGKGFNAGSVLSTLWADPTYCHPGETPLDCEIRINQPGYVFILLGTNDASQNEDFKRYLQLVIDKLISQGVVPILATKADNLEGDQRINQIIYDLSIENEIPIWNYWLAVQPLPNHGLKEDGIHLTWAVKNYDFSNPTSMESAWTWRNLTFLQVLDFLEKSLSGRSQN
jgi:hypothetical protein